MQSSLQKVGARGLRHRAPHEERPRLFRARYVAGEQVVSNSRVLKQRQKAQGFFSSFFSASASGFFSAGLGNCPEAPTLTEPPPAPTPTEPDTVPPEPTLTPTPPARPIGTLIPTLVPTPAQAVSSVKTPATAKNLKENRHVAGIESAQSAIEFIVSIPIIKR
jgi:hypothetical protein